MYLFHFIFDRIGYGFSTSGQLGSANSGFPIGSFPWRRQERQMVSMLPLVTSTCRCPFASICLLSNTNVVWRGYSWFSNIHWWLIPGWSQLRPLWGLCIICYPISQDAWSTVAPPKVRQECTVQTSTFSGLSWAGESTAKQLSFCLILPRVYLLLGLQLSCGMPRYIRIDGWNPASPGIYVINPCKEWD